MLIAGTAILGIGGSPLGIVTAIPSVSHDRSIMALMSVVKLILIFDIALHRRSFHIDIEVSAKQSSSPCLQWALYPLFWAFPKPSKMIPSTAGERCFTLSSVHTP